MSGDVLKAVALRYPPEADAPYITSSAKGFLAEKLISIAQEHKVPIVQNREMVDVLSIQRVGDIIPEETYTVIAGIFAFVARMEKTKDGKREY
ncbi:MAG: EscU/YscU/HrcU family type III secretion system export apparatus switch protein [Treponema sp.]|nr:EscU/YscU/HrcU family type III secretion system export apparatus switch protein [Treponema sp.]